MMQKAGYLQRTGCRAFDREGVVHEVVELHIVGSRYALRIDDLAKAISGHVFVQVESLVRDWNHYLGATCGLAQVSASGKALNIELFDAGNFTISLSALKSVMYGNLRKGVVARIPDQPMQPVWRPRRQTMGQQNISALV
jgi:hypothetical protein